MRQFVRKAKKPWFSFFLGSLVVGQVYKFYFSCAFFHASISLILPKGYNPFNQFDFGLYWGLGDGAYLCN
jgi:hypothetical protein